MDPMASGIHVSAQSAVRAFFGKTDCAMGHPFLRINAHASVGLILAFLRLGVLMSDGVELLDGVAFPKIAAHFEGRCTGL